MPGKTCNPFFSSERVLLIFVSIFLVTLFIPHVQAVNSISIGLLFIYSLFFNSFREKWELLKERKAVQLMFAFFFLHVVSACFSTDKQEGVEMVVLRLPLLLFPATFGLITISEQLKIRMIVVLTVVVTTAALVCMTLSAWQYFHIHEAYVLYSNDLSKWVDKQSTYMASFVSVAIFSCLYLLKTVKSSFSKMAGVFIVMTVLSGFLFMLACRMAIIAFGACALLYLGYLIVKNRSFVLGFTVAGIVVVAFLLLSSFFPKTLSRFTELKHTNYEFSRIAPESNYNYDFSDSQWNGANIRMAIWNCGWQLAGEHPVFGSGLGDKTEAVVDVYKRNNFIFGYTSRRNLHNTYLDVLVTFGTFGFILFLLGYFVLPLWNSIRNKDLLAFFILLELMWQLFPESYLDRSVGCMEAGFFIALAEGWQRRKGNLTAVVVPLTNVQTVPLDEQAISVM